MGRGADLQCLRRGADLRCLRHRARWFRRWSVGSAPAARDP